MYDYMIRYYTEADPFKKEATVIDGAEGLVHAVKAFEILHPTADPFEVKRIGDMLRG